MQQLIWLNRIGGGREEYEKNKETNGVLRLSMVKDLSVLEAVCLCAGGKLKGIL